MVKPVIVIHGGLSLVENKPLKTGETQLALRLICEKAYQFLLRHEALESAVHAVSLLEDDPMFNAGTGSKVQRDGRIRMTAAVMDGAKERFAGVMNIERVRNPVQVAAYLLSEPDRVLSGMEATEYARAQGFHDYDPLTPARQQEYREASASGSTGTVGCVALDAQGNLAAATSTGGKGMEIPGRVSDSATVAGTYANAHAAISCTGIGEEIVDAALAARIAVRVQDGMELDEACKRTLQELHAHNVCGGFIALDREGGIRCIAARPTLTYAASDGEVRVFE